MQLKVSVLRLTISSLFVLVACKGINGQPSIQWQQCYGGSQLDQAVSIKYTNNGFIVAGSTSSIDGDVTGNHDTTGTYGDIWVIKTDTLGNIQWKKCYGGSFSDGANSITQTKDLGYIIAGISWSNDGDVTGHHGIPGTSYDCWIIKLDSLGNIEWQNSYGGSSGDVAYQIIETTDNGYVFCGYTMSTDFDVTFNRGMTDVWIVKLDSAGNLLWQQTYGGSLSEEARDILPTSDNGYIIVGTTSSFDFQVNGHWGASQNPDTWLLKIDSVGNFVWQKCLGGSSVDEGRTIQIYNDKYIIGSVTSSTDGNVSGHFGLSGNYDIWLAITDSNGNLLTQKCLGGSNDEFVNAAQSTIDGMNVLIGTTLSDDGDVIGFHQSPFTADMWMVKFDSTLTIQWQKCIGGTNGDAGADLCVLTDGSYALTGSTHSTDGNVTCYTGNDEFWIVKLDNTVSVNENSLYFSAKVSPNPSNAIFNLQLNSLAINKTSLLVYDLVGNTIIENDITGQEAHNFDLGSFPKGVYLVKLIQGVNTFISRIILI